MWVGSRRAFIGSCVAGAAIRPILAAPALAASARVVIGMVTADGGDANQLGEGIRKGATLAVEQANADGGFDGRQVVLKSMQLSLPDSKLREQAVSIAAKLMADSDLVAVIGHDSAADALPASISYDQRGVLFIAPSIAYSDLTRHGFTNVFASLPDNEDTNRQGARFSYDLGLRSAVVVRARTPEGAEQSLAFRDEAAVLGLATIEERSFRPGQADPQVILSGLQGKRFDAVVIAGPFDDAMALIRHVDQLQLGVVCVLTEITDPVRVRAALAGVSLRVLMPVLRNRDVATPEQKRFSEQFTARFHEVADDWAVQGYDAVGLVREALHQVPGGNQPMIDYLRLEAAIYGVAGRYSFRRNGRIYTRLLSFAEVRPQATVFYSPGS